MIVLPATSRHIGTAVQEGKRTTKGLAWQEKKISEPPPKASRLADPNLVAPPPPPGLDTDFDFGSDSGTDDEELVASMAKDPDYLKKLISSARTEMNTWERELVQDSSTARHSHRVESDQTGAQKKVRKIELTIRTPEVIADEEKMHFSMLSKRL
mgnify:CR=1 FL=1